MKALVFDTETTGLISCIARPLDKQPRVIEFYGELIDTDTGARLAEVDFICDPGCELAPIITKITGLRTHDVAGRAPFADHVDAIAALMRQADACVAHNLSFDRDIIDLEAARAGVAWPWPSRMICTVEQTEWIKSHRLSLTALHTELFGTGFEGGHRARHDVAALTRCFLDLYHKGMI